MTTRAQKQIQDLLETVVAEGKERGVQVAAYLNGKLVIDAWAGIADVRTGRPVAGDTLFPVFSSTKGIAATLIHILAERGRLDYGMRIADCWPEFAANGKENVTLRQALNHTSGIPQMPEGLDHLTLGDWDRMCAEIAKLKPQWPPGSHMEYHAMTFGWILGEVARRVDGRAFAKLMEDEVCRPLGILDDMFVGAPAAVDGRVAFLEAHLPPPAPPPAEPLPVPAAPPSVPPLVWPLHEWMNRADARRACIPASNGIMTARALARHYAALVPGGVDGVELLPPERVRLMTVRQQTEPDSGALLKDRRGLGYGLGGGEGALEGPRETAFGHGGYGGSFACADPERRFAVGLTKNLYFSPKGEAHGQIIAEVRKALGLD